MARNEANRPDLVGCPDYSDRRRNPVGERTAMGEAPDVAGFLRWCDACVSALGTAREEIDALNVYPVPDGDTGTNLFLTFEAATAAGRGADSSLDAVVRAFVDGALRGARGNSGVIMAQLLRAGVRTVSTDPAGLDGPTVAKALTEASAAAYAAVGEPVEGTILTVAREAAAAAEAVAAERETADVAQVLTAAADAARLALARTPEQLETLRRAGVVDAGGRGLCVVLDATVRVLTGRWQPGAEPEIGRQYVPTPVVEGDLTADGPAYEVMYLLDADDDRVPALRQRLTPLGDSLVVVGGEGLWNVHVHVDDVGAAIEAGITAGRPYRIAVTHFAEQAARAGRQPVREGRGVVAMAAGQGLRRLFGEAGAQVVAWRVGQRCSTGEFLDAIQGCRAAEVIVLPNDGDSIAVAEAAAQQARADGVRVSVIPTRVQVQGLAALAVHEPGRSFDDDVVAMTTAAGHARHGGVTIAARQAMTSAGPCEPGDVLGVVEGDFAVVGDDLHDVADQVVHRLLGGGGELMTLVTGDTAPDGLADRLERRIVEERPEVDVVVYDGGQPRYPLLVGVE
jgi:DAK2 domain fusion protein YloV